MISVLGSINLDMIANVGHMPLPGQTISATGFATSPGGKGANQALAARRGGSTVRMVGAVGEDDFAMPALKELREGGVDLTNVQTVSGPGGLALILVDEAGENEIVIVAGANAKVDGEMAPKALHGLGNGDHLLVVQEIPADAIETALVLAARSGTTSLLNIAPVTPDTKRLAPLADMVIANETEFEELDEGKGTGQTLEERGARWARANARTLIITLGDKGAVALRGDEIIRARALPITPLDTVGAGDTFCGYLANGLDMGLDLEAALKRAVVAGALACLKRGAQPAIPLAEQVASRLKA